MYDYALTAEDFPKGIWNRLSEMPAWHLERVSHPIITTKILHLEGNGCNHFFTPLNERLENGWHIEQYFHLLGKEVQEAEWDGEKLYIKSPDIYHTLWLNQNGKYWLSHDVGAVEHILNHNINDDEELISWLSILAPFGMLDKGRMLMGDRTRKIRYDIYEEITNFLHAQKISRLLLTDDKDYNVVLELDGFEALRWNNLFKDPEDMPLHVVDAFRIITHVCSYLSIDEKEMRIIRSGGLMPMSKDLFVNSLKSIIEFIPHFHSKKNVVHS